MRRPIVTITIQQCIDSILASVPGAPFPGTVDTVKLGDAGQPLKSVAVTFLASVKVIEQAARLGANLLITHEPTFYNHLDETDWLRADPVYAAKRRLAEESGLVIWRFHDSLHKLSPDPTLVGLIHELGWDDYALADQPYLCRLPATTLRQVALTVKERLGVATLRVVGDLDRACRTVGVLPGAPGPQAQIGVLGMAEVDAVITGEIHEWETSEYARDAAHQGRAKGLIVTGHAASEEPGMRWMVPWLQERLPGVSIRFIPSGSAFQPL
jgi:putative NIF3 family GTP cyclohydrolase 1 type 2